MKKKRVLEIVSIILIILGVSIIFLSVNKYSYKPNEHKNDKPTYEVAFKVNPLIKFKFTYENNKAIINDFELINDKAKEIFSNENFTSMELNDAIELYGRKLSEAEIIFNTINIFTDWNKIEYFKSEKFNINVEVVDTKFLEDIFNNTKNELVLNKKYYSLKEKSNYKYIMFK